jgi:hypothetical protein
MARQNTLTMDLIVRFYNEKATHNTKRCEFMCRDRMNDILDQILEKTNDKLLKEKVNDMKDYLDRNPIEVTREKIKI